MQNIILLSCLFHKITEYFELQLEILIMYFESKIIVWMCILVLNNISYQLFLIIVGISIQLYFDNFYSTQNPKHTVRNVFTEAEATIITGTNMHIGTFSIRNTTKLFPYDTIISA